MKKWTDVYISQCLDGLPKDKYRQRAQAELTDHLLELCADLESGGYSPEEAQARAVKLMGSPAELNVSFRAEWVHRANGWKFILRNSFSMSLYTYAFNLLVRWFLIMPFLLFGKRALFDFLESDNPIPFILFSILNFLPGAWFTTREWYKSLALHPRRKRLLLLGILSACFWEIGPFLGTGAAFFFLLFLPVVIAGHFPLLLLTVEASFYLVRYAVTILLVAVSFALLYSPRKKSK